MSLTPEEGSSRTEPHTDRRLRRRHVPVPSAAPSTDAMFLVLRRLRVPLITVLVVFSISVAGLCLIPGRDTDGNTYYMSPFDALYLMSYTATTIGFGETPYELLKPQRAWLTLCIYASVLAWAYTIGSILSLLKNKAFSDAMGRQRFARQVRAMRRPFLILVGYGQSGRAAAETLDTLGRSLVVVVNDQESMDALAAGSMAGEIPALMGDARIPGILGLAGLGSKYCEGVLALTEDDAVNLSIVMAGGLLRQEIPVIARTNDRGLAKAMDEFGAQAVVNPFERYGNYLVMRLQRPSTFRLVTWLLATAGTQLTSALPPVPPGQWVVASDDHFGPEIVADLEDAGLDSLLVGLHDGMPDLTLATGFIAGSSDDSRNLAMAAHARLARPDIFLTVRQRSRLNDPLVQAFAPDSVFVPARLTTQEALARVITPDFWDVVERCWDLGEDEASALLRRVSETVGSGSPSSKRIVLDSAQAPAVVRWLRNHELRLGDLFRHPEDRDTTVDAVPMILDRDDVPRFLPDEDALLQPGDAIIAIGRWEAFATMTDALYYDNVVEYVATGREVPATWVFRMLDRRR